jgi:hypothetical protein
MKAILQKPRLDDPPCIADLQDEWRAALLRMAQAVTVEERDQARREIRAIEGAASLALLRAGAITKTVMPPTTRYRKVGETDGTIQKVNSRTGADGPIANCHSRMLATGAPHTHGTTGGSVSNWTHGQGAVGK